MRVKNMKGSARRLRLAVKICNEKYRKSTHILWFVEGLGWRICGIFFYQRQQLCASYHFLVLSFPRKRFSRQT